jgi:predicted DNA-binding antitoxin AbrB/MazE fold protein
MVQSKKQKLDLKYGEQAKAVSEKEQTIEDFNQMIEKSEMAYQKIIGSTQMLIETIDAQGKYTRD